MIDTISGCWRAPIEVTIASYRSRSAKVCTSSKITADAFLPCFVPASLLRISSLLFPKVITLRNTSTAFASAGFDCTICRQASPTIAA